MSRLLHPGECRWYEELLHAAYYGESELERIVEQHARELFPDFLVFPFKRDVQHHLTGVMRRPDLGFIERKYKKWGIIEVELAGKGLPHVREQVDCFVNGTFNNTQMIDYVVTKLTDAGHKRFSRGKISRLIYNERPEIFVLANQDDKNWIDKISVLGAEVSIVEVYKSTKGPYLYRSSGNLPVQYTGEAHLRRQGGRPNLLELIDADTLGIPATLDTLTLIYDGRATRWNIVRDSGKLFLQLAAKMNPLAPGKTYRVLADKRHRYTVMEN